MSLKISKVEFFRLSSSTVKLFFFTIKKKSRLTKVTKFKCLRSGVSIARIEPKSRAPFKGIAPSFNYDYLKRKKKMVLSVRVTFHEKKGGEIS